MEWKILETLSHCSLFSGISLQQLEEMVDHINCKVVKFDKKDIYILAGMPYRHADIILDGKMVARMVSLSGKSVEVSKLYSGDMVAHQLFFLPKIISCQ